MTTLDVSPTQNAALLAAAHSGDAAGVRAALRAGANVDACDKQGASALLRAAQGGHLDLVCALIEAGADLDAQDQTDLNPFLFGCMNNQVELVRLMVEAGADLTRRTRMGGNGLTPAAEKGHLETVLYLLENTSINVNLTNNLGWTALIEAIILGDGGARQQAIVAALLKHGARPGMPDPWGTLPRELAAERGFEAIVEIIDAAAELNLAN
ncbi:MAG: ankyrin repeat domain-containing protein [Arthrobacter sp.]|jgi:ankyrin repeat protein|nr:ankyrin repeat domain-containing protein [Arthrobacter sp.]